MAARYKIVKTTFPDTHGEQGQDEDVSCHKHRTQGGAQRCLNHLYAETRYAANITFFRIVKEG